MPTERVRYLLQGCIVVMLIGAGIITFVALTRTRPLPQQRRAFANVLEVEVRELETEPVRFPVVGYGTVRPKNQVSVVPLVSGRLVYAHPDLAPGKVVPKGELLFEIDATIYEARMKQVDAEISRLEAALTRFDTEMENVIERIGTARQMLEINENDFLTSKNLYEQENVGTQRDVDQLRLVFLKQQDALNQLLARQSMIPHQKLDVQAQLDGARAKLKQSRHELDGTRIECPFDARIESVQATESQVVTAHFSIATLTDMSAFELAVGIDPRDIRWLDPAVQPASLREQGGERAPPVNVRWSLHGQQFSWEGHVSRFERVDERTRTAQMVVEVRDIDMIANVDYGGVESGPALAIGMFCSAELPGAKLEDALLIPRHALYENRWVYVFEPVENDGDSAIGRLGRREVAVLRALEDRVLVDYRSRAGSEVCELSPEDQLVVSRLAKPVVGMAVRLAEHQLADARPSTPSLPETVAAHSLRRRCAVACFSSFFGDK